MNARKIKDDIHAISNLVTRQVNESEHLQTVNRLTEANARIMGYLARNQHKKIFQRDIEKEMSVTRSTVSRVISLMEEKGLVERHPVEQDARLKHLVLTEKALEMHVAIISHIDHVESKLVGDFSEEELELLQSLLQRMKNNLEQ